jgi:serine-type D-Ala-D-Ala carboxypeptidase/endopeptidase (penicillin-binding protein 4)
MQNSNHAMKIIVVFSFILSFGYFNSIHAQQNSVELALTKFTTDASNEFAAISFCAIDLASGDIITDYNSKMALAPASIIKLFSTATAFEEMGAYHRPVTRIYHDGIIDSSGILHGNLWIRGGGDPSLGSRFFEREENIRNFLHGWVDTLQKIGIRKILGNIISDGSEFGYSGAPDGWTWGDMGNYYGSGPSGIVLFDNMTYLSFETGKSAGNQTIISCIDPYIHNLTFRNEVKSGNVTGDNAYAFGAPFLFDRLIKGTLPLNQTAFRVKVSIPDPEILLAQELNYELTSAGIEVEGLAIGQRQAAYKIDYKRKILFYTHKGESIANIAYHTNMRSVNLFAEQLICLANHYKSGNGSSSEAAHYVQSFWEPKIGKGFTITDGSGLSRNNGVSAYHFTQLLKSMKTSANFEEFKKTLPVAGKSGTLSSVCKGQKASGKLFAKSGTMTRIKSYAGYVESESGKTIAFAIIVNNHSTSSSTLVKKMEPIFNAMAQY